jgi:hypothetical protein
VTPARRPRAVARSGPARSWWPYAGRSAI